jgi:hypothetical protein
MVLVALPFSIPRDGDNACDIRIVKFREIKVTYAAIDEAIPLVWGKDSTSWNVGRGLAVGEDAHEPPNIDLVLHLGQMRSFPGYSFEKLANRDGYERLDTEGKKPTVVPIERSSELVEPKFAHYPKVPYPNVDIDEVTRRVQQALPVSYFYFPF